MSSASSTSSSSALHVMTAVNATSPASDLLKIASTKLMKDLADEIDEEMRGSWHSH